MEKFDLALLLQSVAYSGVGIFAVSWIAEQIGWFGRQTAKTKKWIMTGSAVVLAIGAHCVLVYVPVDVVEAAKPFVFIVSSIFSTVFFGEGFHKVTK